MGKTYVAAFLLPTPVAKRLSEIGWEFESPIRLPERLIAVLKEAFDVSSADAYLGMDVLQGHGLKMTALRDTEGKIEHIFVQLRGRKPEELRNVLASAGLSQVDVFVPSEGQSDAPNGGGDRVDC